MGCSSDSDSHGNIMDAISTAGRVHRQPPNSIPLLGLHDDKKQPAASACTGVSDGS